LTLTATGRAVRAQLAAILAEQVDLTVLEWMKVVDEPVFLTVGVRSTADPDRRYDAALDAARREFKHDQLGTGLLSCPSWPRRRAGRVT